MGHRCTRRSEDDSHKLIRDSRGGLTVTYVIYKTKQGAERRELASPRSHRNPMTLVMVSAASPLTDLPRRGRAAESRQGFATNRGLHIEAGKPLPDHDMET